MLYIDIYIYIIYKNTYVLYIMCYIYSCLFQRRPPCQGSHGKHQHLGSLSDLRCHPGRDTLHLHRDATGGLQGHDVVEDLLGLQARLADTAGATEPGVVHRQVAHMAATWEMLPGQIFDGHRHPGTSWDIHGNLMNCIVKTWQSQSWALR